VVEPKSADQTHAAFQALLGAAALDALEPEERRALEAHLASCDTCPAELARLRAAVAAYPLALADREPSAALRGQIETAVRRDLADAVRTENVPRTPPLPLRRAAPPDPPPVARVRPRASVGNPWAVAAALLLAATLGLLAWNLQLRGGEDPPERIETVALQPTDPNAAVDGDLTYLADRGVAILAVRELPPLAPGQVYQAWLIRDGETPVPAGAFDAPVADFAVAVDPERDQALALTIEPGPLGSPRPTGNPIAQAPLPPS